MTYNFVSFPRVHSCVPSCKPFMYHDGFNLDYHNHFNPYYHNYFNQLYKKLVLNIQLPEVKVPACPDVKCPEIPACPDVKCPEIPACPEPKKPIDFSKLTIAIDPSSGEIKDVKTQESTGLVFKECQKIINDHKFFEIGTDGRIRGECEGNSQCKNCVSAINSSIIDKSPGPSLFSEQVSLPEYVFSI